MPSARVAIVWPFVGAGSSSFSSAFTRIGAVTVGEATATDAFASEELASRKPELRSGFDSTRGAENTEELAGFCGAGCHAGAATLGALETEASRRGIAGREEADALRPSPPTAAPTGAPFFNS